MTPAQQQNAAKEFIQRWTGKGYEKGDTQKFWLELLQKVFGISDPYAYAEFEDRVLVDNTNFMDVYLPETRVLIEQKGHDKDLGAPIVQSNGEKITPFLQARKYIAGLPLSRHPRWVVTCNFREFWVYDMEQPHSEPQIILLANLENELYRLNFLVDLGSEHIKREMKLSVDAGNLVAQIYDALLAQYLEPDNPETLRSLNILCVRIVFCLYAEDALLFGRKTAFHDYLAQYPAKDLRRALIDLFQVLDTPVNARDPYIDDALKAFPYVNGGIFSADRRLVIPQFTEELKELLLAKASDDFDWSEISPTIFGAVFESTLNPETRRSGGMHYTSIENIHKVIDPLFLDDLHNEFEDIFRIPQERLQTARLNAFQDKLASLTFFDPACGSGNFLTESYISLRRLENKVIALRNKGQIVMGDIDNPIKVDIHQFYGIEINDFAVSVATTALWIAEQQMLQETARLVQFNIEPFPLKAYHNIHEGNALRIDWADIIAPDKLNYIMGNPPFVGLSLRSDAQQEDMAFVFNDNDRAGRLDYVAAWYKKAANLIKNTQAEVAFVSTNSIVQGEQVPILWEDLFNQGVIINFAYRTFVWSNEASLKAHVHCVIIGFAMHDRKEKYIIEKRRKRQVSNINGYLVDAENIFIQLRGKANPNVPKLVQGNKPWDGGNLILSTEERADLISKYPNTTSFIRKYVGSYEFINNKERWCLWLMGIAPNEYRHVPEIRERLTKCADIRRNTKTVAVQAQADTPMLFSQIRQPDSDYILIPETSSASRSYIPMGFMSKDVIASNSTLVATNATLYLFGVLTSSVHMDWMRTVCGRLKSDYRYSPSVYNNFPWPNPTEEQKARIEQTAQAILDARAKYPDCSLADLYDEVTMPVELRRAHQDNDRAVMAAYGFPTKISESACVAELFKMYQELTK